MSVLFAVLFCAVLAGLDQLFKFLAVEYLKPIEYVDVITDILRFRYVENTGAVFGSFATQTLLLTVFSVVLLVFTVIFLIKNKNKSKFINICLLLMISGGFGNIIDRIRLRYVVDFIEPLFVDFAVFNFADCLITVGAFALIGYLIVDIIKDAKSTKSKKSVDVKKDFDTNGSYGTD
ncbi:MAG: signal peptidase II [Clostridia bacterium]|nr:signal peptidase II [Clostridia bacterium]